MLDLFIPFDGKLSVIEICRASSQDIERMEPFLCTLYAAVRRLLYSPISAITHPITLKCCQQIVTCPKSSGHLFLSKIETSLVVHCSQSGSIKKYYDHYFHFVPTEDAIGFIPGAKFLHPTGGRYQILEYPYISGEHTLQTTIQAGMAVSKLQEFHDKNLVHGDIRSVNMIVSESTVTFIDVDLTAKEGEKYPSTYNHANIPERHRDAVANSSMQKVHDRFALCIIISSHLSIVSETESLHTTVEQLNDMNQSLETIAKALKEHRHEH